MYQLYAVLTFLLEPFLWLWLKIRQQKGKEHDQRFAERFGYAAIQRPAGKLVWFHAASVGESLSVLPLIERLTVRHPELSVLLTTVTVTSAKLVESRLPIKAVHQFLPVDGVRQVRRFLKHWQPDVAIWVESELWPNLLKQTHATGCPMLLINARISERSYQNWKRYHGIARLLMPCFAEVLAQTERTARRFARLGAPNVQYLGNLKYDAPRLPVSTEGLELLRRTLGTRPVWLAASTHPGEEAAILAAHRSLKVRFPDLLTILAPRHPQEGAVIRKQAEELGIECIQRSLKEVLLPNTALYIADTLGELGLFFSISPIVLMGGSLVPQGGHNPLEPARFGCAVLTGPYVHHFTEIFAELEQHGGLLRVADAGALTQAVSGLLTNENLRRQLADAAAAALHEHEGVLERVLAVLDPYVKVR